MSDFILPGSDATGTPALRVPDDIKTSGKSKLTITEQLYASAAIRMCRDAEEIRGWFVLMGIDCAKWNNDVIIYAAHTARLGLVTATEVEKKASRHYLATHSHDVPYGVQK